MSEYMNKFLIQSCSLPVGYQESGRGHRIPVFLITLKFSLPENFRRLIFASFSSSTLLDQGERGLCIIERRRPYPMAEVKRSRSLQVIANFTNFTSFNQLWAGFTGMLLLPGYSTSCCGSPWQQLCLERKAGADSFEGPVLHQVQRPPAAPSHTPHRDWKVIRHLQTTDLLLHLPSIGFSGPWVFPFLLWAGTEKD